MKRRTSIFLFSFIHLVSNAQNVNLAWVKQTGGASFESGFSITTDASGNVYTTGYFSGTVDFDPGPGILNLASLGSGDIFISKLNAAGNFMWAKQLACMTDSNWANSFAIALDAAGNIYTTGVFVGPIDFDPGPGAFILNSLSAVAWSEIFVSKLDASGNFVWAKQFGGTNAYGIGAHSIAVDASGNVLTTGVISGTVDFDPGPGIFNLSTIAASVQSMFISKLNTDGNFAWAKKLGNDGTPCWGVSIAADASGNVYTTGAFGGTVNFPGTVDFDPGPGVFNLTTSAYNTDIFISKLDAAGNFAWAKQLGGPFYDIARSITRDNAGNIYVTGYDVPATGNTDIIVSKLDAAGNFAWTKKMGGAGLEEGFSIAADILGNIYTTGYFNGIADFDPGPGVFNLNASGEQDIFISKLDASGNFVWAKQLEGVGSGIGNSITIDALGNIYTTGRFTETVDFDPGAGTYNLTSVGEEDIFIHKMSRCANSLSFSITTSSCNAYTLNGQTYTASGVYTQTLVNAEGCDSIITLNLTINRITAVISAAACKNYVWNNQTYSTSGTYTDTLVAANGCDSIVTLYLTINRINTVINEAVCKSYTWNNQTYTTSGTYTDTLITANGCDSIITLNLSIMPKLFSTITQSICTGQTYSGYGASGTYIDTLVTANGCDSIRTLQLTVLAKPVPDLGVDKEICSGDSVILYPGLFTSYTWQNGSTQSHMVAKQAGLYSVVVTDNCGTARDEILIKENTCAIYFPSAFTPNNDGKNDWFKILGGYNLKDYHLVVYNRWGQKVFETVDPAKGWNGIFNGQLEPTASFVWYCEFNKPGNTEKIKMKGTVTLIR